MCSIPEMGAHLPLTTTLRIPCKFMTNFKIRTASTLKWVSPIPSGSNKKCLATVLRRLKRYIQR